MYEVKLQNRKDPVIYLRDLFLMSSGPKNDHAATLMSILRILFHPDGLLSVSPI